LEAVRYLHGLSETRLNVVDPPVRDVNDQLVSVI
jgi:hypothetical protein